MQLLFVEYYLDARHATPNGRFRFRASAFEVDFIGRRTDFYR